MGAVFDKGTSEILGLRPRAEATSRVIPTQNWVLDPFQDAVFVLGAPWIVLVLALSAFLVFGPLAATVSIIGIHFVFTVAHHMPTFIRVYGDVDLLRRFKWPLLLAPVIPFTFALAVLGYINYKGYPVEYILVLYLMLAVWDPWHFLMQHYGFMRIYDRHNAAPRELAARMDLLLCVSCFVFIMLASGEWLPALLADLYGSAHLPLIMTVSANTLATLTQVAGLWAGAMVVAYCVYLWWCRRQGYFVSLAKLALFASTFAVMYLAYTPNPWITRVAPGWSFKVGFAAVGIVHMTQYLAIVWRYNRSLALRPGRARAGWFQRLHVRGGWLAGAAYVGFCLFYGAFLTFKHDGRWLASVLLAVGFTSTLTHYYFDGFIWKLRHQQNRENLQLDRAEGSWWSNARPRAAAPVLLRQALYFGIPMAVLTCGALTVWNHRTADYVQHMFRANDLGVQGLAADAAAEGRQAFADMREQLPYMRRLAELQPTSSREAELALLIYNHARYAHVVLPALDGRDVGLKETDSYRAEVEEAIRVLQHAIDRGGSVAHAGHEGMTTDAARGMVESWKRLTRPE
ncbi:MAG TPA: hypothetical protein VGC34_18935 [Steroidobacteraceae bacterium]